MDEANHLLDTTKNFLPGTTLIIFHKLNGLMFQLYFQKLRTKPSQNLVSDEVRIQIQVPLMTKLMVSMIHVLSSPNL